MTDKEKQELVRNIAILIPILGITGVVGFVTGSGFIAFCFIGVAWPLEKKIESVFSEEISSARDKIFAFFDTIYEKIKATWLGGFLSRTPPAIASNLVEEIELESITSDRSTIFSSVSVSPNTKGIYSGLGESISSEFLYWDELESTDLDTDSEDDEDDFVELPANPLNANLQEAKQYSRSQNSLRR